MKKLFLSLFVLGSSAALIGMEAPKHTLKELIDGGLDLKTLITKETKTGVMKLKLRKLGLTSIEGLPVIPGVEGIDLGRNNLTEILAELFINYPNLKYINFNRNQLVSLPDEIGTLKMLQVFGASNNSLSSLPESLGNLESLRYLNLAHNKLESISGDALGKLTALKAEKAKIKFNDNPLNAEDIKKLRAIFGDHLKI